MSDFVSGIFKKCKYGGYFIIYLIAFINLIGFGFCETVSNKLNNVIKYSGTKTLTNTYTNIFNIGGINGTYCVKLTSNNPIMLYYGYASGPTSTPSNKYTLSTDQYNNWICLYGNKDYFNAKLTSNSTTVNYEVFILTDLLNEDITCNIQNCEINIGFNDINNQNTKKYISDTYTPNGTTKNYEIFYNSSFNNIDIDNTYKNAEILVNSGISIGGGTCENDLTQCQNDYTTCNNNLGTCGTQLNSCNNALGSCMQGNIGTGDYNWSAIFINNIQHIGKPIINITIPEEIARDYTGTENSFDLNIEGYGYDEEKMINMIDIQNYKPTSEEMSELISKFADFVPLLGICLLFIAIRYIAKRIFRG